jgi:hypothetical protein
MFRGKPCILIIRPFSVDVLALLVRGRTPISGKYLQKDTSFFISRVRRSANIPPIFVFSGILHPSFASELLSLPRENRNAHAAPQST